MEKSYVEEIRLSRALIMALIRANEDGLSLPKEVQDILKQLSSLHAHQIENGVL